MKEFMSNFEFKAQNLKVFSRDASVAQLVKHLALGFGCGLNLRVVRSSPVSDFVLSAVCWRFSLPPYLPLPLVLACSLSNK